MRIFLSLVIIFISSSCWSKMLSPHDVVVNLYETDLAAKRPLIVDEDVHAIDSQIGNISSDLRQLYADSVDAFKRCLASAGKENKPYMLEMFMLTFQFEYFDSYKIREIEVKSDAATYEVILKNAEYAEAIGKYAVRLENENGRWVVVDISDNKGASLRSILEDYISGSEKECVSR